MFEEETLMMVKKVLNEYEFHLYNNLSDEKLDEYITAFSLFDQDGGGEIEHSEVE